MTNPFLARFDAIAAPAFKAEGLADAALFRAAGTATDIPCSVYVDRSEQLIGEESRTANPLVTITAFAAEVPQPQVGDTFTIGAERFTVDGFGEASDESRFVVTVTPRAIP